MNLRAVSLALAALSASCATAPAASTWRACIDPDYCAGTVFVTQVECDAWRTAADYGDEAACFSDKGKTK